MPKGFEEIVLLTIGILHGNAHGESTKSRGSHPKLYFTITAFGRKAIGYSRQTRNELWKSFPQLVLKPEQM